MKLLVLLFFTNFIFCQSAIISGGNKDETFGEVFPLMQQLDTVVEVSLGIPTFELPKEQPKPVVKKKETFLEKIVNFLKNLFNGNKR